MLCNSKNRFGLPRGTFSGAKLYPAGSNEPRPLTSAFNAAEGWWEEWELEDEPQRQPGRIHLPDGRMLVDRGRPGKVKIRAGKLVTKRYFGAFHVVGGDGHTYHCTER